MKTKEDLIQFLQGKRILYIATKNLDYIRITQELELIKNSGAEVSIIGSNGKSYLKRCFMIFSKLLFHPCRRYDMIVIGFMAQMVVPFFSWKWRGKLVVTDFFVSIYDTLVYDRRSFTNKSLAAKLFKWLDCVTIHKSNYLIADTQNHAQYFAEEFRASLPAIFILYLEADKGIYYPMVLPKPSEWKDKYIVLYFGSILPLQGIEVLLEAVNQLKEYDWIHFLIIGPIGNQHKKPKGSTVTYIDWLSQDELAKKIAIADLCLAGHFSSTISKAKRTIPGKTYIYQAMNKRVVLGDSPANRELFEESNFNLYVKMGDAKALTAVIKNSAEQIRR